MKYAIFFIIGGSQYDERYFDSEQEARGHFDWLFNLPARDHNWDKIQLWEYGAEGARGLLDEKKGL